MHPYFLFRYSLATRLDNELSTSLAHPSEDEPEVEPGDPSGLIFDEERNSGWIATL